MPAILYVETNFVIGIAKGQDPDAERLLVEGDFDLRIVIPAVCIMEAFSTWNTEKKQRQTFYHELGTHAKEAARGISSVRAKSLAGFLRQTQVEGRELLNDIENRLHVTVLNLVLHAEILNNIDQGVIVDTYQEKYIDDLTDNLILCSILRDARSELPGLKMFVSGNSRDFGTSEPVKAMESVGVKYFKAVEPALGWLKEQRHQSEPTDDNLLDAERNPEP